VSAQARAAGVRMSRRQRAIIAFAASQGYRGLVVEDWVAVPQPDAPMSQQQMQDSLDRLADRGLLDLRPGRRYRINEHGSTAAA
jgi:hypothetical protein